MTPTPWNTPLYNLGASFLACNSPCNCRLFTSKISPVFSSVNTGASYRILMVSKGWVAVTAPQAAIPPAINDLVGRTYISLYLHDFVFQDSPCGGRHYGRRRRESREFKCTWSRLLSGRFKLLPTAKTWSEAWKIYTRSKDLAEHERDIGKQAVQYVLLHKSKFESRKTSQTIFPGQGSGPESSVTLNYFLS